MKWTMQKTFGTILLLSTILALVGGCATGADPGWESNVFYWKTNTAPVISELPSGEKVTNQVITSRELILRPDIEASTAVLGQTAGSFWGAEGMAGGAAGAAVLLTLLKSYAAWRNKRDGAPTTDNPSP